MTTNRQKFDELNRGYFKTCAGNWQRMAAAAHERAEHFLEGGNLSSATLCQQQAARDHEMAAMYLLKVI